MTTTPDETVSCDVVVVGGGLVGLMAAVAIASTGAETVLVAGHPAPRDNRTTALLVGSVDALIALGVWEKCRNAAAPLRAMRIVDDTGRLWRAPEVRFDSTEIGLDAFGWNIANRDLVAALEARAAEMSNLAIVAENAAAVTIDDAGVTVAYADGGKIAAKLVVGSDGRRSLCREAAGIPTRGWTYPQTALTFNLGISRDHNDTSTEFHSSAGPFTIVPLPGRRVSVVCVVTPAEAERLHALSPEAMNAEVERRTHSIVGKVTVEPGRGAFPLTVETAKKFAGARVVLVGEAAHVVPPIGAQGLNLGFRDAATVAELLAEARRDGADPGGPTLTAEYDRRRRADVTSRTMAVDLLNRSLLSDLLPVQGIRGLGLWALGRLGPLRRAVMREGVAPALAEPKILRGEPLG
jgi:2-octaprenyl-6-methoxyphenol hydroxylase